MMYLSGHPQRLLESKRLLVTGVANTDSIAFAVAEHAQRYGAEVVLTTFDRTRAETEHAAAALPGPAAVLDLDVTRAEDFDSLAAELRDGWGGIDGALHAVAFAPRETLAGDLLAARPERVGVAFETSTYSFAALARLLAGLLPPGGGSLVGLDFDAGGRAWPVYNWMGVCKAALQAVSRYLARDLGARGARVNLVAAGPLLTKAASGIPDFDCLLDAWDAQAPLVWHADDAAPVADAVCFLFSDLARAITGEVLHVDGGFHAMAAPPQRRNGAT